MNKRALLVVPIALGIAAVIYLMTLRGPAEPDLPEYAAVGDAGEPAPRLRLTSERGAKFEITLRPRSMPASKIVAYAFAFAPGQEPSPIEGRVELLADGTVRLSGASRALLDAREIRVVVGPSTAIGKFDDALARANERGDARVRVVSIPIER